MNQQCSALFKHYHMFYLFVTVPNFCPQPKMPLINHLTNNHLLGA